MGGLNRIMAINRRSYEVFTSLRNKVVFLRASMTFKYILLTAPIVGASFTPPVADLFNTSYSRQAFNQRIILERFSSVLESEGLSLPQQDAPSGVRQFQQYALGCLGGLLERGQASQELNPLLQGRSEDLNEILVQEFFKHKFQGRIRPFYDATLRASFSALLFIGGPFAVTVSPYLESVSFVIGAYEILNWINTSRQAFTNVYLAPNDPMIDMEIRYVKLKRFLDPFLQEKIEDKFMSAQGNPYLFEGIKRYMETALWLPVFPQNISMKNSTPFLEDYFRKYDPPKALSIGGWIKSYTDFPHRARRHLYLKGLPGIGKTHFIKELGLWFGVPVIKVPTPTPQESLEGTETSPGVILRAITEQNPSQVKGGILFFDEATGLFQSPERYDVLKQILDPEDPKLHSSFLGLTVPLKSFLIVLGGNEFPQNDSFNDRLILVEFPKPTMDLIKSSLEKYILPEDFWNQEGPLNFRYWEQKAQEWGVKKA